MTKSRLPVGSTDLPSKSLTKIRQCLKCKTTFQSEWAGDRICSRCKRKASWRQSGPLTSSPRNNRY
jgi:uncharacterized paraquat-inducible protein A